MSFANTFSQSVAYHSLGVLSLKVYFLFADPYSQLLNHHFKCSIREWWCSSVVQYTPSTEEAPGSVSTPQKTVAFLSPILNKDCVSPLGCQNIYHNSY